MTGQLRTSIIFGGSSGIGKAIAERCARDGDAIVLVARKRLKLRRAAEDISRAGASRVHCLSADLGDAGGLRELLEELAEICPAPRRLVLNGGGPPMLRFMEIALGQWKSSIQSVLLSQVQILQSVVPRMTRGGSVVAILSDAVRNAGPEKVLACSLRLGVLGMIKCMALQFAGEGIRFNAVSPGPTETERALEVQGRLAAQRKKRLKDGLRDYCRKLPMKRMAKPEEIAAVVHFLLSDEAAYVTGMNYVCDGGLTTAPM